MLFIAETFNPNMQHYSSKTKSPLNTSGSHQSTSIYPLNFNSDIKIISATFVKEFSMRCYIHLFFCIVFVTRKFEICIPKERKMYSL